MTFKFLEPKSILKWAAALLVLGILLVGGLIAWGMGVRWPTLHRVDQPGIPDSIYVKAVDFLDDSGYVVEVHFETCCSDRTACTGPAGRLFKKNEHVLTRHASESWISLRYASKSVCPWVFSHLEIRKAGVVVPVDAHRFVYGIFDDSTSSRKERLDPECLRYFDSRYVGDSLDGLGSPEECNSKSSVRVDFRTLDTLILVRGAE